MNAVNGIADSGMVVGMTRGRAWIVVLGLLLGGIVAINVWGLGMSASSSATAAKIDELQRANSVLGGRIANRLSNEAIATTAADLGLAVPAADAVTYLDGDGSDADRAAERLANGKISLGAPAEAASEEALEPELIPVTDPAAVVPADPAVTAVDPSVTPVTESVDPVAVAPVETVDPTVAAAAPVDPAAATPATGAIAP